MYDEPFEKLQQVITKLVFVLKHLMLVAAKSPNSMYFVAIVCPPKLDEKVRRFKIWMLDHYGCRVAMRTPAHITLIPPFWLEDTNEGLLLQTLSSLQSDLEQLNIRLTEFSHFSKKVIFIGVLSSDGLTQVRSAIEQHFRQTIGDLIKTDDRIATRDLKPGDFISAWEHFRKIPFDESFSTSVISLLKLSPEKWNVIAEKNWKAGHLS
jgi:2'-5' RNA ligase